jgi:hypothetical protein
MQRARTAAEALHRPLEEVLTDMLAATLPDVEDAPPETQADLAGMTWLSTRELWMIARSEMPAEQQQQLQDLAEFQTERPLSLEEEESLEMLRREYGRITLFKARAYALLSLRGGQPLLADE